MSASFASSDASAIPISQPWTARGVTTGAGPTAPSRAVEASSPARGPRPPWRPMEGDARAEVSRSGPATPTTAVCHSSPRTVREGVWARHGSHRDCPTWALPVHVLCIVAGVPDLQSAHALARRMCGRGVWGRGGGWVWDAGDDPGLRAGDCLGPRDSMGRRHAVRGGRGVLAWPYNGAGRGVPTLE